MTNSTAPISQQLSAIYTAVTHGNAGGESKIKNLVKDTIQSPNPSQIISLRQSVNAEVEEFTELESMLKSASEFCQFLNQEVQARQRALDSVCYALRKAEGKTGLTDLMPSYAGYYLKKEQAETKSKVDMTAPEQKATKYKEFDKGFKGLKKIAQ